MQDAKKKKKKKSIRNQCLRAYQPKKGNDMFIVDIYYKLHTS